jgi:hypothetical protein
VKEDGPVLPTNGISKHRLEEGDVWAVVHCYGDRDAYEIEMPTRWGS